MAHGSNHRCVGLVIFGLVHQLGQAAFAAVDRRQGLGIDGRIAGLVGGGGKGTGCSTASGVAAGFGVSG
jgi:hypothetical protein